MKTYDPKKKRKVFTGEIKGKIYKRKVNNKHYMVKEHGYGIQKDILPELVKRGVRWVMLEAKQTTYKTTLTTWLSRGKTRDYGHGEQVFLDTSFMEKL